MRRYCNSVTLTVNEDGMGKAKSLGELVGEIKGSATALWRRYELITAWLSQELAEQLRLVMEPTVASKLQGDYKTGKRINMEKVRMPLKLFFTFYFV